MHSYVFYAPFGLRSFYVEAPGFAANDRLVFTSLGYYWDWIVTEINNYQEG